MIKNLDEAVKNVFGFKGITDDSRNVGKDFIFVAVRGVGNDGHEFVKEAIKNGAALIVGEDNLSLKNYIKVTDSREALGTLASAFYNNPSLKLKVIGVTGTKGKTTTCHIIEHILKSLGKKVGILSSISVPGLHVTTPGSVFLHKKLAEFVAEGKEYAVIEVSSHGIAQKRIAGVKFDVGVLTNIAPEHLDYHKTFSEYKKVKMSFINSCKEKVIASKKPSIDVLPGEYNNINAEAALEAVEKLGIDKKEAIKTLSSFEFPEGRLEFLKNKRGVKVVIDFAHTPDSLRALLTYLRTQTKGKLFSVFGCAGERDTKKRKEMGKISGELADLSIFTAEDPRGEDVFDIFRQMKKSAKNFVVIPERGEAIAYALSVAEDKDLVALLGKGHEKSMAYEKFENPWDDKEAVLNYLNGRKDISVIVLAGGKGTRMRSEYPKVIHKICGRPMIAYTLENLRRSGFKDITIVVSFRKNLVVKRVFGAVKIAYQKNPKGGTADAAKAGFEKINPNSKTLIVMNGDDSAFYRPETIKEVIKIHEERDRKLTFVSLIKQDPTGLGRVVRGKNGLITKLVEEKDASFEEKKIKEVNDGLYVFNRNWFADNINKVKKGKQGEYYLTDLIKIAIDQGMRIATYTLPNDDEWQGINTPEELEKAVKKMEERLK